MSEELNVKKAYRYAPCPSYDVEGMESWLSDMAAEGFHLDKDGCWGSLTTFVKGESKFVRYRLQAAKHSTSMWADNYGDPEAEEVEISQEYGWEYVAKRGNFYVYRTEEPGNRELNTDPAVQALALKEVEKRCCSDYFWFFIWVGIDLILAGYGSMIRSLVYLGLGMFLLGAAVLIWMAADYLAESIHMRKLRKKLLADGYLDHEKNWKEKSRLYYIKRVVKPILCILFAVLFLQQWGDELMDEDKILIEEYEEEVPFATMQDFADGEHEFQMTYWDWTNVVKPWSFWIAPENYEWNEHAKVAREDGTCVEGGLDIAYHEVRYEWLAELLVEEHLRKMKLEKNYEPLEAEILGVDDCHVYRNQIHFPEVVIRKGSKVMIAEFYQTSDDYTMPLDEWVQILADSI